MPGPPESLTATDLFDQIRQRLGFVPPFFLPARETPEVLADLWSQTLRGYLENPIPALFKEKLAALIARYCTVPYCMMCHSASLRPLGMSSADIISILEGNDFDDDEIAASARLLAQTPTVDGWPAPGSKPENAILALSVAIFLNRKEVDGHGPLRHFLGPALYNYLILFIGYNRVALTWAEAHPELRFTDDERFQNYLAADFADDSSIKSFFENFAARSAIQSTRQEAWLTRENKRLLEDERMRIQSYFAQAPVGFAVLKEPTHTIVVDNPLFEKLTGTKSSIGRPLREILSHPCHGELFDNFDASFSSGEKFNGAKQSFVPGILVDVHVQPYRNEHDQVAGLIVILIDVSETERLQHTVTDAHRETADAQLQLRSAVAGMPVGVAILTGPEHIYTLTNTEHDRFLGDRVLIGRSVADAVPEAATTGLVELLDRVYQTGETFASEATEFVFDHAGAGKKRFVIKFAYQAQRNSAGEVYAILVTAIDVTAFAEAQAASKRSERRALKAEELLRDAIVIARVGFFDWNVKDNVFILSDRFRQDWGVPDGGSFSDLIGYLHADDRDRVRSLVETSIANRAPYLAEYRVVRPSDGRAIWVEAQGRADYGADGEAVRFFGTTVDITERKSLELITHSVANLMPQMAWMTDSSGAITWYNQRWYDYTGTTFGQMAGWGWRSVHHPDEVERVTAKIKESFETGKIWEDTFPLRGADGRYRWFLSRAVPIRDAHGKILNWFGTNTDITEQRDAENELSRMAAVVQNSKDFIGMSDTAFHPIFVNGGGRLMTGFGSRDITKHQIRDFFAEEDRAALEADVLPDLLKHGYWEGELRFRHFETGALIPVLYNLFPLYDRTGRDHIGYATVTRDISERKKLEDNLRDAHDAATKANLAKSAFLANMSHEIRSPLGAIMGFADLLRAPGIKQNELNDFTSVIDRNSKHLLRIVDDILDLSKVEAGMLMVEAIDFSLLELLSDFASMMGFRARDKGLRFELEFLSEVPNPIISDPTRLRQILMNMVSNAIKFTSHGHVRLTVTYAALTLTFRSDDTGIGLSDEQKNRLFKPFQQADSSTTRTHGGTGLGLVLTRRLCEAMGGDFWLERSEPSRGSTFVARVKIELPAEVVMVDANAAVAHSRQKAAIDTGQPLLGARILLIEDSPDNQFLINLILSKVGATVTIANDGLEGVQLALPNHFDLVICDMQMPRMDGYQTVHALRSRGFAVPIVALTAHAMKEEHASALAAGFSDYLTKPINKGELISILTSYYKPNPPPRTEIHPGLDQD